MKQPSTILQQVIADMRVREERGLMKYGTTVDRTDLTQAQWLQHAYEEALDLAIYLKKVMSMTFTPDRNLSTVIHSRFKKGDVVICWLKGSSYGDKFTVLSDTGGLTLLCHKSGSLCIVNNRDDYDYA